MKRISRTIAAAGLAAVLAAGLAAVAAPWRVSRSAVVSAFSDAAGHGLDLQAAVRGRVTLKLLPRPRLQARNLSVSAQDGAVLLDAPLLKAELDIPSLLRGAWRMTSATLVGPTLTVDLDSVAARATRAARAGPRPDAGRLSAPVDAPADGAPVMVRLRSGLLKTRSASGIADLLATAVDASATWSSDGLVAAGTATLRGTTAKFTGAVQRPWLGLTAAGSPASLQIDSPLFSFSADGVVSDSAAVGDAQPQFAGRASLATPALPRLLHALDSSFPLASKRAQVGGDLVAKRRELSLSGVQLRLDGARFEGALAWRQEEGGRGLLAGTLATDMLDLGALAGDRPEGPDGGDLYGRPLTATPFAADVDLRVSATAARLGRVSLQDAAFGALMRDDRLELTLDEAGAYGGLVKARAVLTAGPDGIDAHAELSAKRVGLGPMFESMAGWGRVDGALSGHAALDGHGADLRAVVSDLEGDGQVGVDGVRVAGLPMPPMPPMARRSGARAPPDRSAAPTLFDRAQWDLSIHDGVLRIPDGRLTAAGLAVSFGAEAGLADGRVDLTAVAARTDGAEAPPRGGAAEAAVPFALRGFWTGPLTLIAAQPGPAPAEVPRRDGVGAGR